MFKQWPVIRQIIELNASAPGETAFSERSLALRSRTQKADKVARSICPYCAVGCSQLVFVKDDKITDIEGDPDSPISLGTPSARDPHATFRTQRRGHGAMEVTDQAAVSGSQDRAERRG